MARWFTLSGRRPLRRRRAVLVFIPFIILIGYLFWPLSSRQWEIRGVNAEGSAKRKYLESQKAASGRGAPRVILIVADDLGQMDLRLYAGRTAPAHTPAIDRIAQEGAYFTDASATATICAPSRAAILTGRYQQRFGFELQPHDRYARNRLEYLVFRHIIDTDHMRPVGPQPIPKRTDVARQGLPAHQVTIAELLKARGYRTAAYGKWHLGYDRARFSPLLRGFDEHYGFYEAFSLYAPIGTPGIVDTPIDDFSDEHMWSRGRRGASAIVHNDVVVEENAYLTFRFGELASEFIEDHAEEPFFLYLPFSAPHTPLQAPREHYDALSHIEDPARRTYAAMITALDDAVATVLDAVDRAGIAEETMIIFTSDNGGTSYLGVTDNGTYAGGKFTNFQGGVAVPLLLRYPDAVPAGVRYDKPVSLLDVFATIAFATNPSAGAMSEAAAPPAPSHATDGVNLVPFLRGERTDHPHDALYFRSMYNRAVRAKDWKLLVTSDGSPGVDSGSRRVELYNLRTDPAERTDVSRENPDIVHELTRRLETWETDLAEPLWPPVMHFWLEIWGRRLWFAI